VTFDKDVGELAFRRSLAASVGVVLFRITLTSPEHAVRVAVAAFASRADWSGQFPRATRYGARQNERLQSK
jgi:hypothetical protein